VRFAKSRNSARRASPRARQAIRYSPDSVQAFHTYTRTRPCHAHGATRKPQRARQRAEGRAQVALHPRFGVRNDRISATAGGGGGWATAASRWRGYIVATTSLDHLESFPQWSTPTLRSTPRFFAAVPRYKSPVPRSSVPCATPSRSISLRRFRGLAEHCRRRRVCPCLQLHPLDAIFFRWL